MEIKVLKPTDCDPLKPWITIFLYDLYKINITINKNGK